LPRSFALALAALSGLLLLVLAGPASAHVVATPAFLPSEGSESIDLEIPNERSEPMTSFALKAPAGLEIRHVHPVDGWDVELVDETTARWSGGSLALGEIATFGVTLEASREPGTVALESEQRYDSGAVVPWPVLLTVTPPTDSPSENLALAGVIGLIGVLVIVGIALLAWRRRPS
jgi:hypothetical protein